MNYPVIDPIILTIGPVFGIERDIHWYGVMYLFAFIFAFVIAHLRSKAPNSPVQKDQVEDLILFGALGVILGGRIGYVLFYNFEQFLADPLWLLKVWEGGMSFHGGLLGVIVATWLFSKKINCSFVALADFIAPTVPIGLGLGRLGNFINQELWGRETDLSIGMVFPNDPWGLTRHPSQLYQFALEGVVLFIALYWFSKKPRPKFAVSALFLILYGLFRFIVEFAREPDSHIGFDLFGWMSRGQILSLPMLIVGIILMWVAYKQTYTTVKQGKV